MNTPTKAITIRDPWAQAIIHGPKRVENRGQRLRKMLGERVAVHVSKTVDTEAWYQLDENRYFPGDLPKYMAAQDFHHPGQIIGSVRLVGWFENNLGPMFGEFEMEVLPDTTWWKRVAESMQAGVAHGLDRYAVENNPWFQGPVGWLLDDVIEYRPVEARGMPGFWTIDEEIREKLEEI